MTSKIEDGINDIIDYLDNCKAAPFSSTKIIVEREEIDELLGELKKNAPEEIKQLRKIVANKEAILNDAKDKAQALIEDATNKTNQLLSENEIMLQAYNQADAIVDAATEQAQQIVDAATEDANGIRAAAFKYMDDKMAELEDIVASAIDANNQKANDFQNLLQSYFDVLEANRSELHVNDEVMDDVVAEPSAGVVTGPVNTGEINLDII